MKTVFGVSLGVALLCATTLARAEDSAGNNPLDLIAKECSTCHGPKGLSTSPTFPHLAGQQAEYLDVQLKAFRDKSRADPHAQAYMWGMAAQLTDPAIAQIAAFFAKQPAPPKNSADPTEIAAGKKTPCERHVVDDHARGGARFHAAELELAPVRQRHVERAAPQPRRECKRYPRSDRQVDQGFLGRLRDDPYRFADC